MAKIYEELYLVKISRAVKSNEKPNLIVDDPALMSEVISSMLVNAGLSCGGDIVEIDRIEE